MDFNKPRVAIYYFVVPQTGYRNDGPPLFINYNLRKILNGKPDMASDTGNVVHLWPGVHLDKFGKFDLNILVDHGEDAIGVPLDWEIPSPSAYWVSDAHLGYEYRLKRAKQMDYVFCAQRRAMSEFIRDGVDPKKVFFLPHAVEPDVYKPYPIIEKWDWCFIGHMNSPERIALLDRFCKEWPVGQKGYLGWRMPEAPGFNVLDDIAKKFSQSRIILNQNIQDDINMRTFEAMATGRCLLTSDIPTLPELFSSWKHLVTYTSIDDAVEKAHRLLVDADVRNSIAQEGYREVLAHHTYSHRASEMLEKTIGYRHSMEELINAH